MVASVQKGTFRRLEGRLLGMARAVAKRMADGEVFGVGVAAFTKRLYVFKRGSGLQHMFAADPTRHKAVHLPGYRFINFVARVGKFAHGRQRVFKTG